MRVQSTEKVNGLQVHIYWQRFMPDGTTKGFSLDNKGNPFKFYRTDRAKIDAPIEETTAAVYYA